MFIQSLKQKFIVIWLILSLMCTLLSASLNIDVYVESRCPFSVNFMNTTLRKAIYTPGIEKLVNITLYPYGNAVEYQKSDGQWNFTCQHGASECYGNLMQVCGMSLIQNPINKLKYVVCLYYEKFPSSKQYFDYRNQICAPQYGISAIDINKCMNSSVGNSLQHQAAVKTKQLNPTHKFVPWITNNNIYNATVAKQIRLNLVQWACQNSKDIGVLSVCQQYQ